MDAKSGEQPLPMKQYNSEQSQDERIGQTKEPQEAYPRQSPLGQPQTAYVGQTDPKEPQALYAGQNSSQQHLPDADQTPPGQPNNSITPPVSI